MKTKCPYCGYVEDVHEEYLGATGECGRCHRDYTIAAHVPLEQAQITPSSQYKGYLSDANRMLFDSSSGFRENYKRLIEDLEKVAAFNGYPHVEVDDIGFLNPKRGERIYYCERSALLSESISAANSEMKEVGRGDLYVTNKRFVFVYGARVREILYREMSTFICDWLPFRGSVKIGVGTRARMQAFTSIDALMIGLLYHYAQNGDLAHIVEHHGRDEVGSLGWEMDLQCLLNYMAPALDALVASEKFMAELERKWNREQAEADRRERERRYVQAQQEAEAAERARREKVITWAIIIAVALFVICLAMT